MNNAFTDYLDQMQSRDSAPADVQKVAPAPVAPSPAIGGAANEYLDSLRQRQDMEDGTLNAFARAHKANPDEWAKMLKRGEASGLSREVMEQFPAEAERRAQEESVARMVKTSPRVAAWLTKPNHAEIAKDDTDALSTLEQTWNSLGLEWNRASIQREYGALKFRREFGGVLSADEEKRMSFTKAQLKTLEKQRADLMSIPGIVGLQAYSARQMIGAQGPALAGAAAGAAGGAATGATGGVIAGLINPLPGPEDVVTIGGGAVAGAGHGARLGYKAGMAFDSFRQEAAFIHDELDDLRDASGKPLDKDMKRGAAAFGGMINAALDTVGDLAILKVAPGLEKLLTRGGKDAVKVALKSPTVRAAMANYGKRIAKGVSIEAATEGAQEIISILARDSATMMSDGAFASPDRGEDLNRVLRSAVEGGIGSSGIASAVGAPGAVRDVKQARDMKRQQEFMQSIGDAATASKLRERMPSKYRELVDEIAKGGPVENIRIQAETFATYFQGIGIDPVAVAQEVGARNFDAALAAHTDIIIPVGDYAAKIAATEHHAALMPDIRLRDGDLTAREYEAYKADRADIDAQMATEAGQQAGGEKKDALSIIEAHFRDQLLALGRSPAVADAYATAQARPIMNLAMQSGVDPMAIIEKYGLTVTSPLPDVLTQKGNTEASIDALLERLRTGDIPQDEAIYGQRLTDFLRKSGGINDTQGELKGRDLDKNLKPGQSRLVRDDGLDFDAALTAARQAGYLPEDRPDETGINDLLDALLQDEQGSVYSSKTTNDELLQLRGMLESLGGYLDSLGIDLTQITDNAQVRALMKQAGDVVIDASQIEQTLYQSADDNRGYITIGADRKLSIALLEKANLSTFLHETGHAWLEIMGDLAESAGASEQLKADWAKTLKFLKVATRAEIGVEQHELWARANEAYLMEGNAPSAELRGVFQKFKSWLKLIYKQIEALNVKLTPEVRGVFDRLYASEAEIESAKKEAETRPLFLDAAKSGMTEAEFALYTKAIADGTETAKENLESSLMREQQRETQKWWKDARDTIKAEVTAEVEATPVYRAFAALSAGQMPDGTPIRLSRDDLVKRYGEAWLKKLPRGFGYLYAKEGGADIQTAAEMLGFSGADLLVNALADMRPKKELIKAETDARMRDTYGDTLNDAEAMRQAAVSALHNDRQAEVLALELRALRKKRLDVAPFVRQERARAKDEKQAARAVVDAIPPLSAFRDAAAGMISQMQARDIRPGDYLRASQKANRDAFKAMAKDDHQAAYEAKRRELLNHYLYREALAAREEVDSILDKARSFEKIATRQRIGKAGADYLEQIDGLLERYEFKRVSMRTMDRRTSLALWAEKMEAEGHAVNIDPELLDDAKIVNFSEASMDTLRAVRDALVNIEHLAGLKNKLLKKKGAIEWEAVETELLGALAANTKSIGTLGEINRFGESIKDKGARLWRKFDAAHLKVEQIVEWLDGGKIDGPWARYFFDLADDAQTREYDLHKEITKRLQDLSESMPKEWRDGLIERVPGFSLPGISASQTTRATLISIALNAGNTSNLDKMLRGHGWTQPQLDDAFAKMSEADWKFVQGVWDTLETLWPEIAALEKRVSGVEPPRVEAREIETPWGVMRGGYYPMVYDPKRSSAGEKQADATESVQDFMARGYGLASTSKGHTKARLDEFAAPLRLDYEQVLSSHLSKVIKDISHREAVIGLTKILKSRAIKPELIDRLGEEKYTLLNEWVQTLISDRADTLHQSLSLHNSLFRGLRTNTAIVTMGWKISTMMSQIAGFGPSVDLVGYRNLSAATVAFTTHPKDTLAMVFEKSGEMRHRTNTIERDMKEQLLKLRGNPGLMAATQRTAFYLTAMADRMVSVPTWLAGYRKALAEGLAEDDAVRAGDRSVRLSQGAGGAKDLAAVQRQSELMKLLTMYYMPFSVLYARLRDVGQTTNSVRDLPRLVARSLALVILPAVLGELLAGRGPDDDEDEVWWAARKAILYPSASVPILRDLVSWQLEPALVEATGGTMHFAPKYQFSPILSAIQKIGGIPSKTLDALTGDREWDEVAWDVFEASGYVFGLPTAQPRITGEYLTDLMGGDANPEGIGEALHDLAFRRPRQ